MTPRWPMRAAALAVVVLASPRAGHALDPGKAVTQYRLESWLSADGLPNDSVFVVRQTRDGYLWLGTPEGLARFDGLRFTIFDRGNTPALETNYVAVIEESSDGSLWIGTSGGGLLRYADGRFTDVSRRVGLTSIYVWALVEDPDGSLWIGTGGGGLIRWKEGESTVYGAADGLGSDRVNALARGRDGSLWIATDGAGLARMRDGRFTSYGSAEGLGDLQVHTVMEDRHGNVWAGTARGLSRFENGRFRNFTTRDGLSHDVVLSVYEDRAGSLWIGTDGGGLNRLSDGLFTALTEQDGLSSDFVWSFWEDREGSLWVGTDGGGLSRLGDGKFTTYTHREGLPSNVIKSVLADRDGRLWVGTRGDGLARLEGGRFHTYTTADGLASNDINVVSEDRAGTLWVGTNGGFSRLAGDRFESWSTRDGLPNDQVYAVHGDANGVLWIGTWGGGLARFEDGRFTVYTVADGLPNDIVWDLLDDSAGDLWIATNGGGLARLRDGVFTTFTTADGLGNDVVVSLYEDSDKTLWIGTWDGGLNRLRDGRFTNYTIADGLGDDVVFDILEDARGNLWMASNKGVFGVAKSELNAFAAGRVARLTSFAYGTADGLRSSECKAGARGRDGRLWFATPKGLATIDPAQIPVNRLRPPVVIERFTVDETPVSLSGPAELAPHPKRLEFRYTALSLMVPERSRFRFRLEGYDRDWVQAGDRRTASYTGLSPGRYRFKVIASNNDGVWNEDGAAFAFRITSRFYETGWFYLVGGAALPLLGFVGYRWRVAHYSARQRDLERLVEERTSALEEANRRLERLTRVDALTGVANRRHFEQVLESEWRRMARTGEPLSLLMIDLDRFKEYNDAYGHQRGDDCLVAVADLLGRVAKRAGDVIVRYGGEEFAAILPATDDAAAIVLAQRIREAVVELGRVHAASPHGVVTVSIGAASVRPPVTSPPDMLIASADRALYEAKRRGRNLVATAAPTVAPMG